MRRIRAIVYGAIPWALPTIYAIVLHIVHEMIITSHIVAHAMDRLYRALHCIYGDKDDISDVMNHVIWFMNAAIPCMEMLHNFLKITTLSENLICNVQHFHKTFISNVQLYID